MPASDSDADLAFTYAWWLTGDPSAAEAAVRRAASSVSSDASPDEHRVSLLEAVRAGAVQGRTMCPASELAILHDLSGLDLPQAARVAGIDPADARTELAHGRLEALPHTVREPFAHPERLGGLAVGNPPDVAHARQCTGCGEVARRLAEGRDALRALPQPAVPPKLATLLRSAPASDDAEELQAVGSAELDEPQRVISFVDAALEAPYEEESVEPTQPSGGAGRRWLLPAVVTLAVALLAVTLMANLRGGAGGVDDADRPTAVDGVGGPTSDTGGSGPALGAFTVDGVGMIRRGQFTPAGPGIVLTTTDRVRIALRYSGATDGVVVAGRWTIDGRPFRELRVALSSRRSMHVFAAPLPADGWPAGLHHVVLSVGDAVVATVDFRVV